MRLFDGGAMSFTAIVRYPLRSAMLLVAISIGVAAVLLLLPLRIIALRVATLSAICLLVDRGIALG